MQDDHPRFFGWSNTYWRISTVFLLVGLVVLLLEVLGVFHEIGVVLTIVGMWISMYLGLAGAEERSVEPLQLMVRGLDARLESIDARLDSQTRVLMEIRDPLRDR